MIQASSGFGPGPVDRAQPEDEIGVLLDIGALDVKERAGDENTRAVVLSEDKGLQPLEALLKSASFDLNRTAILSYLGVTKLKQLKPLVSMIRASNPKAKLLLHRDRDYLTVEEAKMWEQGVREIGVEPFLTGGVDIESHFLGGDYLAEVNSSRTREELDSLISETETAVAESMIESYVNGRVQITRDAGGAREVNPGKLATEATKAVDQDPVRWCHGKTFLKELRRRYQEKFAANLVVFEPSDTIRVDVIVGVAKKAFGSGASGAS